MVVITSERLTVTVDCSSWHFAELYIYIPKKELLKDNVIDDDNAKLLLAGHC